MKSRLDEQSIALRVAREFIDGSFVNLDMVCPVYVPILSRKIRPSFFQSENGVLGYGSLASDEEKDYELINACDQPVTASPDVFLDSGSSFDMIRAGISM